VADRLRARGHAVLLALPGEGWTQADRHTCTVDVSSVADVSVAIETAAALVPGATRVGIVHAGAVDHDAPATATSSPRPLRRRAFDDLVVLAQALARTGVPADLAVLTSGVHEVVGGERLAPHGALALGVARVMPRELPSPRVLAADIDLADDPDTAVGRLLGEMGDLCADGQPHGPARVIAVRGGRRWRQVYTKAPVAARSSGVKIRPDGFYLVTGGLGGLGTVVTEWLANQGAAVLVTSRTAPDDIADLDLSESEGTASRRPGQTKIRAWVEAGLRVMTARADVTCEADVERALSAATARWGELRGVIHAAGLPGAGLIELKDLRRAAEVLAPKVEGTLALAAALEGHAPDFVVLFGSNGANVGSLGQVDYCAANAFVGAVAHDWARRQNVVTLHWGPWRDSGMSVDVDLPEALLAARRVDGEEWGMSDQEGLRALARALELAGGPEVIVSPAPVQLLIDRSPAVAAGQTPTAMAPSDAPAMTPTERACRVWSEMLGGSVGPDDNFFDLGGDSLLAIQVARGTSEALGSKISVADIFDRQCVRRLVVGLGEQETTALPTPVTVTEPGGGTREMSRRDLAQRRREQRRRRTGRG
jgi:NAD(P)-dependent dehydrogenase (short-subunit alcohol dehydrogenase family)